MFPSPPPGEATAVHAAGGCPASDRWVLSDARVLAAVRVTGTSIEPAGLTDLIAAVDAVHRLIPSREEIEHGVRLLQGTGLIQVDGRNFWVTPAGRSLVAHARPTAADGPLGSCGRTEVLFRLLAGIPLIISGWTLDERAYETACLEYRHTVWDEFRRERQSGRRPVGLGFTGRGAASRGSAGFGSAGFGGGR